MDLHNAGHSSADSKKLSSKEKKLKRREVSFSLEISTVQFMRLVRDGMLLIHKDEIMAFKYLDQFKDMMDPDDIKQIVQMMEDMHISTSTQQSAAQFSTGEKELAKKKAVDEAIKAAYVKDDHLADFPAFHTYDRNGLLVHLKSGSGEYLSSPMKRYIQELLKVNMENVYGPQWVSEEKIKRREMVSREALYIFVQSLQSAHHDGINDREGIHKCYWTGDGDPVVAFVHYRFIVEEEIPVVYVYELQLEKCVQGRGLGKFLMQLIELIAHKNNMRAVMLTVQKRNTSAMNFYTTKLRYTVSNISPSRVDPLIGADKSYEILCKTFSYEAKTKLEEDGCSGAN